MSSELDRKHEERGERRRSKLVRAIEFELAGVLRDNEMELLGFSVKIEEWECLMTLRVWADGQRLVGFVGSDSLPNCIVKSVHAVKNNKVQWKEDKYR